MQSITTVTQKGQVTLPIGIRQLLKIKSYDKVMISFSRGKIIIEPVLNILDFAGSVSVNPKVSVSQARKLMEKNYRPV
ncbi:AbrB/MazE/SpoVT family DNA-binding domain-containing protein [Candidatus Woesebacteria bacterium]|nr:AbrB/MazE/SpoVT family DNA-binding domain-containing protein [Candidatus Woesebacteria bacterium]